MDSFLGLQEVRNKKINTYDLLELIESKELFSEEIARREDIENIIRESKKYIFNSNIFDKSGLIDCLNDSGLTDISTHVENFELQFYSDKSSKLDYSFEIDERVLKDHFKSEIRISKETVIKTDNFEKLILDGGVSLEGDVIRLVVDRECLEEIKQKLGE